MERIWLASYSPGVPADIDPEAYPSLREIFDRSCERFAERRAFTCMGATLSYARLDALSRAFAAWLQHEAGLERGQRVAIMLPNLLQYPVALFGALRAGLTVVNVNPLYTPRELRHQLQDSGAETIVILENFAHVLEAVIAETSVRTVVTTRLGDLLPTPKGQLVNVVARYIKRMVPPWQIPGAIAMPGALRRGAGLPLRDVPLGPDDIAFLQYTGGTTGPARGTILTHRNMVANLEQASAWLGDALREGEEVIITALPLYHIFSLLANCMTFIRFGGENVLVPNPRDIPGFVRLLRTTRFTAMTGVNTLFNALLNHPDFAELDFSSLRLTLGGGMAVQRRVAERWREVTGCTLLEAYGLTETSPAACINPLDLEAFNGSVGLPVPSTDISIRDSEGNELGIGEVGELCVRGPQVTPGYWGRPEESADAFFEGGWLRTGDMARVDERGFVYIVDRRKDMILVSGFNVYPNEVEDVLVTHPKVLEAAVVGAPDPDHGERVCAFVVTSGPGVTEEELIAHCREGLTRYKVPREIHFRTELPKTNVGKILRRALREEITQSRTGSAA
ncbi:AMP-binding protein [Spiribacter halobius]|uniref:Long-chain-fatty-acid--CoA ligase n=1 Tax=Sediminicurvatus halobius TaxID=2182432 RepID=A0A2U2MXJ5_9GAMM|nr:AMP-binding protein [Spiribacter halobius]PWG61635.1 long-chain-fatty-acid--CoA ligase [Spiribacter halobius]UEX79467.1 AMP-binding protein [Spiribacter halobius]